MSTRRRAALCVPGSEPAKIDKALRLDVDEVVVDLEDAVSVDRKDDAREQVVRLGRRERGTLAVRVNGVGTEWFLADLAVCARNGSVTSIVLPKVESGADLDLVERELARLEHAADRRTPLGVQALIESPAGVVNVHAIAGASDRLTALIIGYADLAASTGRRPRASWQFVQDAVLLAARVAGIQAIDGPHLGVDADQDFELLLAHAEALGFDGKWVIHPRQVDATQAAFTPDRAETAEAAEILTAMDEALSDGRGATQWRGRMLDEAVAQNARRVLARGGIQ
ncbi:MAG: (3S)-malyl-CoA thiolesterase [Marmoricola sp.]|nr:(3S)-malyl-CoA thiolesterase [Marmoricola sp.]